jgi:hypothetical protein
VTYGRYPSSPDQLIWAAKREAEGQACRRCGDVVSDPEWATICRLAGIPAYRDVGLCICAKFVRRQQEANRYAARVAAEDDERRRSSRPPIGLRLVGVVARQRQTH